MASSVTSGSEQPLPCTIVSHTKHGLFSVCHIREVIRKHCFENGRRPLKGSLQEGELVGLLFSTISLSGVHEGRQL